jgi:ligand-binding SRPBCC domain-containing protein
VFAAISSSYPAPDAGTHRPTSPGCKAWRVKVRLLERSQRVEIPAKVAFEFYADTHNLEPMTPPWLNFRLTNPGPVTMEPGALLTYTLKLHGVPIHWTTRIDSWDPPTGFVDTQLKGPYALWAHTHVFEQDGENATIIHDSVRYAIPFGPFGALAHRLFVRRDLRRIFDYRAEAFERLVANGTAAVAE